MHLLRLSLLGALVASFLSPTDARAQNDGLAFSAAAIHGLGGSAEGKGDFGGSTDLDATIGMALRVDGGIAEGWRIGGMFQVASFNPDPGDRDPALDFDVFISYRHDFSLRNGDTLTVYGLGPAGFSVGFMNIGGDDANPGFNLGILGGAEYELSGGLGVFLENGWRHHNLFGGNSFADGHIAFNQFALNIGVRYAR